MRRLPALLLTVLLAAFAAAPAAAQEDERPKRLEGGDALKWRRPARAWPLLELDRFDRDLLGPDPDRPELQSEIDFDLLWPLFGYHNEVYDTPHLPRHERGYFYTLPVWWNTWRGDRSTYTLFPLFTWWDRPGKPGLTIYPALFDLDVWDDGFELDFPWPFAQVRSDDDGWNSRLWPVWWAGADEDEWWWTVFPLFGGWQSRYDAGAKRYRETGFFTPVGGGYAWPGGHYAMATPLYHDWRDGDERGRLLLPLLLHYTDDRTHAVVTPIASYIRADDDLYWAVTPLYHHWRSADGDEGADVLFPLFWHFFEPKDRTTLLLPLGGHWRSPVDSGLIALNAYARWDKHGRLTHAGLWPFFWYQEEADRRMRALWPLYGEVRHYDPRAKRPADAPFQYRASDFYRREASVAWPLFQWISDDRDGRRQLWFPFPFVTAGRTDQHAWFHIGPALYTNSNHTGFQMELAPLFLGPIGTYTHTRDRFFLGLLWPWGMNLSVDDHSTSFWLAWPALRWWHNADGDWTFRLLHEGLAIEREDDRFEWRVLYRFLRYRSTDDTFLFEFNPFFRYQSEGDDWHFSLFMGAYQVWTHGDELKHQLFWSIEW